MENQFINLENRNTKNIALFRALQLGDMLCAIPAARALKTAFPASRITLIGLPWAKSFVERFPKYFSSFIPFPGYPGIPEQTFDPDRFAEFMREAKARKFDLAIQMHGNGSVTNSVIEKLGAMKTAGFYRQGTTPPSGGLFMPFPENIPELKRHLKLAEFLGAPAQGEHLEFPVTAQERRRFEILARSFLLRPGEYVCIHPGARDRNRWWAPRKFADIADMVAGKGYQVVFTGTDAENEIANTIMSLMHYPAFNLTGKTELGVLAALIENARLLVSNDTGVSHIAAAVKTPSVVVFLTSDPERWAPINRRLHRVVPPEASDDVDYVLSTTRRMLVQKKPGKHSPKDGLKAI